MGVADVGCHLAPTPNTAFDGRLPNVPQPKDKSSCGATGVASAKKAAFVSEGRPRIATTRCAVSLTGLKQKQKPTQFMIWLVMQHKVDR